MSHKPVSDEDYFSALPANGLDVAEQTLRDDLALLQENELPTKDTVIGLLMVRDLQQKVS